MLALDVGRHPLPFALGCDIKRGVGAPAGSKVGRKDGAPGVTHRGHHSAANSAPCASDQHDFIFKIGPNDPSLIALRLLSSIHRPMSPVPSPSSPYV